MPEIVREGLVQRQIFPKVVGHLDKSEITLITGPRQAGKTVLLRMLQEWLVKEKKVEPRRILSFNLDIAKDWEFFQDQTSFIEFLRERSLKRKIYVFVDEAQRVPNCARFFKGVFDSNLNIKLILTGSASLELKTRLKESLAGRKRVFRLMPFSFAEFLQVRDEELLELLKEPKISSLSQKKLLSLFREYTLWGGYPRAVFARDEEEKINILSEIYTSYVEKDIVGFLRVKNRLGFSKLVKLLSGQIGQLINIAELSNSLNLDRLTIERYLKALQETFIVTPLLPYFRNPRQEIIKQNKIYFNDTGVRNYALENFSLLTERQDAGLLFENAVFNEALLKLSPLEKMRFWRTKQGAEVDFLIVSGEMVLPIEAKLSLKKPHISVSLKNFIEKYSPENALVANTSLQGELTYKETRVRFVHPYKIGPAKIRLPVVKK